MILRKSAFLVIVLAMSVFSIEAKEWTCTKYPKLPIVVQGCEGEMCGRLMYEKAERAVSIYEKPFTTSRVIDQLARCELIRNFEPYIVVNTIGRVEVLSLDKDLAAAGVKVGDILPYVRANDEDDVFGELTACFGDREHPVYDTVVAEDNPQYRFATIVKVLSRHASQEWIKLKTPRNKVGYAPGNSEFYMSYYRYRPMAHCPGDKPTSTKSS